MSFVAIVVMRKHKVTTVTYHMLFLNSKVKTIFAKLHKRMSELHWIVPIRDKPDHQQGSWRRLGEGGGQIQHGHA